jgi:SsrA-binding protein
VAKDSNVGDKPGTKKIIATNRKARHNYSILDVFEAGVALLGTEVKSLREGHASLADAFATVDDGEVWLRNLHIPEYHHGSWTNHEPRRTRKLLLHRGQIDNLIGKIRDGNLTLGAVVDVFLRGQGQGRARTGPGQAGTRQTPGHGPPRRRARSDSRTGPPS